MPTLFWDSETRSLADIRKVGVYRYAEHPSTAHILSRFRLDDARQVEVRFGDPLPTEIRDALLDMNVRIVAHNATFERLLLRNVLAPRHGWPDVSRDLARWHCTMARARASGLPGSLEGALAGLGLPVQKDKEGHSLMLRMCRPRRLEADGTPVWWEDEPRLARLAEYCGVDVDGTRVLDRRLPPLAEGEHAIWAATEEINDRGVRFDLAFVEAARRTAEDARKDLDRKMHAVTCGEVRAASNVTALKEWLVRQGLEFLPPTDDDQDEDDDGAGFELRRADIIRMLADLRLPYMVAGRVVEPLVREALTIRLEAAKSSVKKLDSIAARADARGYVQGLLGYHGASTGRFTGTGGVQIQNFPRETVDNWDAAREALDLGAATVDALYGPPLDTVSKMLRGSIMPSGGCELISADYAAVELRGVAWLAGQTDLVEDLRAGARIYEQMAAKVFGRKPEEIGKDSRERWVGKQVVLGSGYQMGATKFEAMCAALGRPVESDLAKKAITTYRGAYPKISGLWAAMEGAARAAVLAEGKRITTADGRIAFRRDGDMLRLRLPSGRYLYYRKPEVELDQEHNREGVTYWGVDSRTRRWSKIRMFGGRWTENAVQALCRDLMILGMQRLRAAGYAIITTVHDEIVVEKPIGQGDVDEVVRLMCELPDWAAGFPLSAEGWKGDRYG
ncbi:bifunctional 3'-5' exonuclease/DNA polymerase [uncultured Caudovirales phage]|uniref:Bifunctional 3'-5' exonuclease/DNA polymerase n=1 Tax=uncultured Caudovirales phage TaxID=2100421 RepID=A0A6J5M3N5_9CAUD|nr:bifunctional 3'-5' exonuclease/DNA polymerase [uncultured Caudovirales phage]